MGRAGDFTVLKSYIDNLAGALKDIHPALVVLAQPQMAGDGQ